MDDLLKSIADLHVYGNKEEERTFEKFKETVFDELRDAEKAVLIELHEHHPNTLRHSVMVAQDVVYVADKMGLPQDKIIALKVASLLHDVGKLDIHSAIINLGGFDERVAVWKNAHPGEEVPKGALMDDISLRDIISYKSTKSSDPQEFLDSFDKWVKERGIEKFLDHSLIQYLQTHQEATKKILLPMGVTDQVIEYAANHHPKYFDDSTRNKLPEECIIIEIADKFNSIIQSEGVRTYFSKMGKAEALGIVFHELKKEFAGFLHTFGKKVLLILASRHLVPCIEGEIIPLAQHCLTIPKGKALSKISAENVKKALTQVSITLKLSKELGGLIDGKLDDRLEVYKKELKDMLNVK